MQLIPIPPEIQRSMENSEHLDASHICPSSSPCASPAFIVPKANPNILLQWVNNYCQLNENTVTDCHLLPCIDDILSNCVKGKIWATIDMTNSFFSNADES